MYTKIYDRVWSMLKRKGVSQGGKMLYIYLFSCSHRTLLGIYKLPVSYIAEDLELSQQAVKKLISELNKSDLIEYDTANSCVFVKKFLECNEIPNKNVEKKAVKVATNDLPSTFLLEHFLLEVAQLKEKLPNLFETVLKRYCEQFNKSYGEQYAKWYGNTEYRKQNTEDRIQKAEAEDRTVSPAEAGSAADAGEDFVSVLDMYHEQISPSMPVSCEGLFRGYVDKLSAPVVGKAISKAVAAGVTTWSYVNSILSDWAEKGIDTLDKVQAEQDRFRASKAGPYVPGSVPVADAQQVAADVEWMRKFLESKRREGETRDG